MERSCCGGPGGADRRSFLRTLGLGTLATWGASFPVMAGPFDNPNFDIHIPADKKLDPDWVKALFERGMPEVYRGQEVDKIRLPIGGIGAGHVYLSGEGVLVDFRLDEKLHQFKNGFFLRTVAGGKTEVHQLNRQNFPDITFRGEYPIAKIEYRKAELPVQASLEAFSPFVPLNADDSGLPATVFNFTLKNTSDAPVEATLAGSLQNPASFYHRNRRLGTRRNQVIRDTGWSVLNCTAQIDDSGDAAPNARPEIVFEDWTKETFEGWTVEGTGFGAGPYVREDLEKKLGGKLGGESVRLVNSFMGDGDRGTGKLTSAPFPISRRFIKVWIGGGDLEGKVGVNLLVDGKVARTLTGAQENPLSLHFFDTRELEGKQAVLEIFDNSSGFWGQIGVGRISFTDTLASTTPEPDLKNDEGSMVLALLGAAPEVAIANGGLGLGGQPGGDASVPISKELIGTLGRTVQLKPGESVQVTFVVAWHFANLYMDRLGEVGRYYGKKFDSAKAVAAYVGANFTSLAAATRLWRDTWYDSTIPYWFLDRTFLNTSTLATSGCYRFGDGRFYAWEGGPACCAGTCTHVWQYAHSAGRLFPELERDTRERVDLGIALRPDSGVMGFRAEFATSLAVDGQAGTILRFYREHQMSSDDAFLKRNWEKIKLTYNPLLALDPDEDGIMEGAQMNTLDQPWYGQISWMSSLYVAALRAGEQMANEAGDTAFAARCRKIAETGTKSITERLYNGEYFYNLLDPKHADTVNSGTGSHIDQVYGQGWAFQVGLPRVLPQKETRQALEALWKYNFSPDACAYFTEHRPPGRQYVHTGDAGMIMCTFPRTDWDYKRASGSGKGYAYYFIETWTGQEHQVAGHMFWEGMLLEPLAIVRAIHDRYHPLKRNPYSEEECGGHYARAMASHGAFIGLCGYEYHGPQGLLGFAPKLAPENFRAPFTAAEGWGTYAQALAGGKMTASVEMKSGRLRLRTLLLTPDAAAKLQAPTVKATLDGAALPAACVLADGRVKVSFANGITIPAGKKLALEIA